VIDGLKVQENVELRRRTRFGIGGVADLYAETADPEAFAQAVGICRSRGYRFYVMGDGSNVIVSDDGFRGLILRFVARSLSRDGLTVWADAGASLQSLVDFAGEAGLRGLETLAGIPGSVGAAVYGNAGAYGHSISERVTWVQFFDGEKVRRFVSAQCEFDYRESIFKRNKSWVIFRAALECEAASAATLRKTAREIMAVRDKKFPPTMRCAGSIFKNLHLANLPPKVAAAVPKEVVREGKVASAYFLEQVGAKGMRRGGIEIASYHANLIYNTGTGTAADLRALILELKRRVREKYGFEVEEEVQYVGEFRDGGKNGG
jgi:UDP-N-acetylmuramate dehydrogenase